MSDLPKRIRIYASGNPFETRIVDADTDQQVEGVTAADLTILPETMQCVLYVERRVVVEVVEADLTAVVTDTATHDPEFLRWKTGGKA